jgi:hypothetical protein
MEPQKLFNEMLSTIIRPALKQKGFTKTRQSFYYPYEGNWGMINFQKSTRSSSGEVIFTVNVGVVSNRILTFLSAIDANKKPGGIWDTQWWERLGRLLPENDDLWWTLDSRTNVDDLGQYLLENILNYALPAIHQYIRDESLCALWLTEKSPSLTTFQRLLYLTRLLKEFGPAELLETTISALQKESAGQPCAITAKIYLDKLRKL